MLRAELESRPRAVPTASISRFGRVKTLPPGGVRTPLWDESLVVLIMACRRAVGCASLLSRSCGAGIVERDIGESFGE